MQYPASFPNSDANSSGFYMPYYPMYIPQEPTYCDRKGIKKEKKKEWIKSLVKE